MRLTVTGRCRWLVTSQCCISLFALWSASSSVARADDFGVEHYESPAARAQGGADVTSAIDAPTNAALEDESSIEAVRLDERATVTEGERGVRAIKKILRMDFESSTDPLREVELLSQQLQDVYDAVGRRKIVITNRTRLEFANVRIPARTGNYQVGAFSHLFAAAEADLPPQPNITNIHVDDEGPYLDLRKRRRVAAAQAISESGLRFGYGRAFSVGKRSRLAVGAALRGFGVIRTALHALTTEPIVRYEDDIARPRRVRWHSGGGLGVDLHGAFDVGDPLVRARVALRLEDTVGVLVMEHGTEIRRPRLGLGVRVLPFYLLKDGRTTLQLDLERMDRGVPAVQLGMHRRFGNPRYSATPAIGACFLERDWLGNTHSPHITFGLGAKIAWLFLQATAEWMAPSDDFEAAISFGLSS